MNLSLEKIGEKDRTVFFIEWLPYEDREALLSEADIGVTLHTRHVETHFSIRTRVLDYIWARLPILVSEGDVTSEWVHEYALGRVIRPQDSDAVTQAILEILSVPKSSWYPQFDKSVTDFAGPKWLIRCANIVYIDHLQLTICQLDEEQVRLKVKRSGEVAWQGLAISGEIRVEKPYLFVLAGILETTLQNCFERFHEYMIRFVPRS